MTIIVGGLKPKSKIAARNAHGKKNLSIFVWFSALQYPQCGITSSWIPQRTSGGIPEWTSVGITEETSGKFLNFPGDILHSPIRISEGPLGGIRGGTSVGIAELKTWRYLWILLELLWTSLMELLEQPLNELLYGRNPRRNFWINPWRNFCSG